MPVAFGTPLKSANTQRWRHALAPWGIRPSRGGPAAAGAAHRPNLAARGAEPHKIGIAAARLETADRSER
jgi:hypothetical protein